MLQAEQECEIQHAQGYFIGAAQPKFLRDIRQQVLDENYLYANKKRA